MRKIWAELSCDSKIFESLKKSLKDRTGLFNEVHFGQGSTKALENKSESESFAHYKQKS